MKHVNVGDLTIANDKPLTLLAGPCQLESADHAQMIAGTLKEACDAAGAQFVFKGSFDKANRTSLNAKPALGLDEGLKVLELGGPRVTRTLGWIHRRGLAPAAAARAFVGFFDSAPEPA